MTSWIGTLSNFFLFLRTVCSLIFARISSSSAYFSYILFGSLFSLISSYSYLTAFKKKFMPEDVLITGLLFYGLPILLFLESRKGELALLEPCFDTSVASRFSLKLIELCFAFCPSLSRFSTVPPYVLAGGEHELCISVVRWRSFTPLFIYFLILKSI